MHCLISINLISLCSTIWSQFIFEWRSLLMQAAPWHQLLKNSKLNLDAALWQLYDIARDVCTTYVFQSTAVAFQGSSKYQCSSHFDTATLTLSYAICHHLSFWFNLVYYFYLKSETDFFFIWDRTALFG